MAKSDRDKARDNQRKMDSPPRRQDPYVTGNRNAPDSHYRNGGEVQSGGSGSNNNGGGKAKMQQHSMPTVSPWAKAL